MNVIFYYGCHKTDNCRQIKNFIFAKYLKLTNIIQCWLDIHETVI